MPTGLNSNESFQDAVQQSLKLKYFDVNAATAAATHANDIPGG